MIDGSNDVFRPTEVRVGVLLKNLKFGGVAPGNPLIFGIKMMMHRPIHTAYDVVRQYADIKKLNFCVNLTHSSALSYDVVRSMNGPNSDVPNHGAHGAAAPPFCQWSKTFLKPYTSEY